LKTRSLNQKVDSIHRKGEAGMTLIEVMVALFITGLTMAGIVTGYEYCLTSSAKDALYMSANAKAQERLEQARAAQWIVFGASPVDQLTVSNFPPEVVVLEGFAQSTNAVTATVTTTITPISFTPPIRRVHVDCFWLFQGTIPITNSVETDRAPTQ
jgi:prepilin-type N-terminal cleavage/methylation domain-containing protein